MPTRSLPSALLGCALVVMCLCSCASERSAQRALPPLKPPADNLFCPVAGDHGTGMPPPPRTAGQLSEPDIRGTFTAKAGVTRECYEERVRRGYDIHGRVGLRFTVTTEGRVKDLCLVEDESRDAELISCLFAELSTWQYPPRPEATEVRHRFTFRSGG